MNVSKLSELTWMPKILQSPIDANFINPEIKSLLTQTG